MNSPDLSATVAGTCLEVPKGQATPTHKGLHVTSRQLTMRQTPQTVLGTTYVCTHWGHVSASVTYI